MSPTFKCAPLIKSATAISFFPSGSTRSISSAPLPHLTINCRFPFGMERIFPGSPAGDQAVAVAEVIRTCTGRSLPEKQNRVLGHLAYARIRRSITAASSVQSTEPSTFRIFVAMVTPFSGWGDLVLGDEVVAGDVGRVLFVCGYDDIRLLQGYSEPVMMVMSLEPVVRVVPVREIAEVSGFYDSASVFVFVLFHFPMV